MTELGTVRNHGYDAAGYERLERLDGIAECPDCGKEVEMWSDSEVHTGQRIAGRNVYAHSEYGCPHGVCEACHILIADNFGRIECYRLKGGK